MRKIIDNIRRYFKVYLITFIVSILIGLGIFLAFYLTSVTKYVGALDGTGVSSLALAGISLLMWIGRLGAYDSMSYGFKQLFTSMFAKSPNKHRDFAGYKEEKYEKRKMSSKYYFVILFVSALFLIAFIILEIIKSAVFIR